ncbi:MAG TPA: RHS repeat-associated core domain-containing protein, partial [Burkholderiaceae bacterium]|nr:RHS repeat-associated core domain-containing protein [Burkholderiaceae bacterium]
YDALGRVASRTQTVNANPTSKAFRIDYANGPGRPTGLTYPSGRVVAYGFNAGGQVTSITVDGVTVLASAEYLPFGAVQKWVWANGQVYERTYDLDGRVDTLTTGPATGTYGDLSQVFGYDSLNRLISAQLAAGQSQGFAYDANGNRTSATINGAATTYTYPTTSHRLTSLSGATTRSFTYDAAGNTASSAGITYVYDGRGRMKQAGSTTYLVNGQGQRVKKASGAAETYFAYDEAGHLIGEYDGSGSPIEETVWLGDIPVAVLKPNSGSFDVFYIWADHLGTPRLITDAANNSRWEWPNNDPFGNNAPNENPGGLGVFAYNLRFPGQYYDVESGLSYNYNRDYDSKLGRYIQSDPIGLRGGVSTYGYVAQDPLALIDETGLDAWNRDPGFRWKPGGPHVPNPASVNPNLWLFTNCVQRCYPDVITITATTNGHSSGAHAAGQAIDFIMPGGGAGANKALCCALECGAKFVQDEYHYPSRNSTGGHIHAQLIPGQGGATGTGSKPKPTCQSCSTAAGTGVN